MLGMQSEKYTAHLPDPNIRTAIPTAATIPLSLYVLRKATEDGLSIAEACQSEPGLPAPCTIYAAATRDPEVGKAMLAFRQARAYLIDEEIEALTNMLTDLDGRTMTTVEAKRLDVAIKSKQWLAATKLPQVFSGRGPSTPTVSIKIETNLFDGGGEMEATPGIFEINVPAPKVGGEEEEQE